MTSSYVQEAIETTNIAIEITSYVAIERTNAAITSDLLEVNQRYILLEDKINLIQQQSPIMIE